MGNPILLPEGLTLDEEVELPEGLVLDELQIPGDKKLSRAQLIQLQSDVERFRPDPNIPAPPINPTAIATGIRDVIPDAARGAAAFKGMQMGARIPGGPFIKGAGAVGGLALGAFGGEELLAKPLKATGLFGDEPTDTLLNIFGIGTGNIAADEMLETLIGAGAGKLIGKGFIAGKNIAEDILEPGAKPFKRFMGRVFKDRLSPLDTGLAASYKNLQDKFGLEFQLTPNLRDNELFGKLVGFAGRGRLRAITAANSKITEEFLKKEGFAGVAASFKDEMVSSDMAKGLNNSLFRQVKDKVSSLRPGELPGDAKRAVEFINGADTQLRRYRGLERNLYNSVRVGMRGKVIPLSRNSREGIREILTDLDSSIKGGADNLSGIKSEIENLLSPVSTATREGGSPILSSQGKSLVQGLTFERLKKLRTALFHKIDSRMFKSLDDTRLIQIRNLIGSDLDDAVRSQPNGARLFSILKRAHIVTKGRFDLYNNETQRIFAGKLKDVWTNIFANAETAQKFLRTFKGREGKRLARVEAVTRLLRKHENSDELIDMNRVFLEWKNRTSPGLSQMFTVGQRKNIGDIFEFAARTGARTGTAFGENILAIREGQAILQGGQGLLQAAKGSGAQAIGGLEMAGTTLSVIMGIRKFTEKVLLSPEFAEVVLKLGKVQAGIKEAKTLGTKFFKLLKGTEITLEATNKQGKKEQFDFKIPQVTPDQLADIGARGRRF